MGSMIHHLLMVFIIYLMEHERLANLAYFIVGNFDDGKELLNNI
jgi:hypothetical protein